MNLFWTGYALPTVILVAEILAIIVPLLLGVAYFTYAERKVIGYARALGLDAEKFAADYQKHYGYAPDYHAASAVADLVLAAADRMRERL